MYSCLNKKKKKVRWYKITQTFKRELWLSAIRTYHLSFLAIFFVRYVLERKIYFQITFIS